MNKRNLPERVLCLCELRIQLDHVALELCDERAELVDIDRLHGFLLSESCKRRHDVLRGVDLTWK